MPVTTDGITESSALRLRSAIASTTTVTIARIAIAVCAAVAAVTGSNSFLPILASPVDSDSYCGSKESPSTAGASTRVVPSSTPSSSRVLVTSRRVPLARCNS